MSFLATLPLQLIFGTFFLIIVVYYWLKYACTESQAQKAARYTFTGQPWIRGKRILVLANPHGGTKTAVKSYESVVKVMLSKAGAELVLVKTTHRGHAEEIAIGLCQKKNLEYDAVITCSGDGMFRELINGFNSTEESKVSGVLSKLRLGIIPCGTSNGMSTSLGSRTPYEACKRFIEGKGGIPLDVMSFQTLNTPSPSYFWDTHVFSWGIVADHDDLVERKIRWMGKTLKELYAPLHVIMKRKTYNGAVSFLPASDPLAASDSSDVSFSDPSSLSACPSQPNWKHISGDFLLVSACSLDWASHDTRFAPGITTSDGCVGILVIRSCSRLQLIRTFLAMASGGHIGQPWVEYYKATAFSISPGPGSSDYDSSGEDVPVSDVICRVSRGAITVLC